MSLELADLKEMDFDLEMTGFDLGEIGDLINPIPDINFPEYNESVKDEVKYSECPKCGYKWPK